MSPPFTLHARCSAFAFRGPAFDGAQAGPSESRGPRSRFRVVRACGVAVLALVSLGTPVGAATLVDRVMAVVSGTIITLSDVRAAMEFRLVDTGVTSDPIGVALEALIERALILDEVNRLAESEPNAAEIDRRIDEIGRRFPSPDAFARAVAGFGMTAGHLHDLIRDNLRIRDYLDERFEAPARPTEAEVEEYYREHEQELVREAQRPTPMNPRDLARSRLHQRRRQALVKEWVDRLRRRANVMDLYLAPGPAPSPGRQ